ncbi:MAG TPA: glycoside hydrolase family 65 [Verrucomicrobiae bacterium]|nr:glycoside hydrolase family 65 [Verrucomicrobiae bacterium]
MKGASLLATVVALLLVAPFCACEAATDSSLPPIDRHALVTRHDPSVRQFDAESPLSVGNGEFAFTADVTGLQTFAEAFDNTTPLGTLSQWGWHTFPNPNGWSIDKFMYKMFDVFGREVGYADVPHNQHTPEIDWLRANPHRLHLGRIGFVLTKADGSAAQTNDLGGIEQILDMWDGDLVSDFTLEGIPVEVQTICHPTLDLLAVRVTSRLLRQGRIGIKIQFPYGTGATTTADWTRPDAHQTILKQTGPDRAEFARRLDNDTYSVRAAWTTGATLQEIAKHTYVLGSATNLETLDFVCAFSPQPASGDLPNFEQTRETARAHWNNFWRTGGAIDLSLSKDLRWRELERRIVLSQYLTAIQCSGSFPPQETGLTYNSWEGKFHLEMHWWHAAHFALWNRLPLLERSLGYYRSILPRAQATAKRQGYRGARWPKMTNPDGAESPSPIGPFLIWQQPHPIFYAELCYRAHPDRATLDKYKDVVMETAEFMASYATWDEATKRYVLGPVLQCSQEIFPKDKTLNPTFELTYWRWGLETAQRWRERLGLSRDPKWDRVLAGLASPAVSDGKYLFAETAPDCYKDRKWVRDHPSVTAALGFLPGPGIDRETMRRTLDWIWNNWNWPETWGWDYPMVAMCAARLGEPDRAVDALLLDTPKNHYGANGHNYQRPGLTIYLPGNGGLLYATAMMAAGWDGGPKGPAPGFPKDGKWTVRWEGLRPAP